MLPFASQRRIIFQLFRLGSSLLMLFFDANRFVLNPSLHFCFPPSLLLLSYLPLYLSCWRRVSLTRARPATPVFAASSPRRQPPKVDSADDRLQRASAGLGHRLLPGQLAALRHFLSLVNSFAFRVRRTQRYLCFYNALCCVHRRYTVAATEARGGGGGGGGAYRKYRSLGTPPRLTFQARLLHNQENVNTDRYV